MAKFPPFRGSGGASSPKDSGDADLPPAVSLAAVVDGLGRQLAELRTRIERLEASATPAANVPEPAPSPPWNREEIKTSVGQA